MTAAVAAIAAAQQATSVTAAAAAAQQSAGMVRNNKDEQAAAAAQEAAAIVRNDIDEQVIVQVQPRGRGREVLEHAYCEKINDHISRIPFSNFFLLPREFNPFLSRCECM